MGESTVRIGVTTNTGPAEKGITSVKGLLQGLGVEAKKSILMGVGLGSGVAAFNLLQGAVQNAIGYVGDALDAASALNESQSKAKVVFGDSAKEIFRWASTAATSMGMSSQAAIEARATYGNLFQAFGLGREESVKMSGALVELASDLASFNNTSVDDALVALRSGLSGETEPLKRYGVAISDARIRTELAAMGFKNLGATLTPLQKTTGAYAIIMKDSALAQGDFARTADESANAGRTVEAQMADLAAEVGSGILPLWKELQNIAKDQLLPALIGVTKAVKDAKPVWDALGFVVGKVADGLKVIGAPLILAAAGIDAVTGSAKRAGPAFHDFSNSGKVAMLELKEGVSTGSEEIVEDFAELPEQMADAMLAEQQKLKDAGAQLVRFMAEALSPAQERARALAFLASQAYRDGISSGTPAVVKKAQELRDLALGVLQQTGGAFAGGMNLASAWKNGLLTGLEYARISMIRELGIIKSYMYGQSPPKRGPLRDIDKGGYNIGTSWLENFNKGLGGGLKLPSVPGMAGGGGLATAGAAMGGGGGGAIHTHIYLDGRQIAESVSYHQSFERPDTGLLPR